MASDLLQWLAAAGLASAFAAALAMALRSALRGAFGAGVAYAAWIVVPVATLAATLPRAEAPVATLPVMHALLAPLQAVATAAGHVSGEGSPTTLLAVWLAGALATVAFFMLRQRAFVRGLGALARRPDGLYASKQDRGLPAVIGVWRARIVVPADYERRFDATQRGLLVAHERQHIARGDIRINACVIALRCVLWFNPILHAAAGAFRRDQELSCDRRVLTRHPGSLRAYAEAMFNTQLVAQSVPIGCQWNPIHPLMERITMLRIPAPSRLRRFAGSGAIIVLLCATGYGAWAAQPGTASQGSKATAPAATTNASPVGEMTPPAYPAQALGKSGATVSGAVVLKLLVGADGNVHDVEVESATPSGVFDRVSVDAAKKWKFHPATSHGKAVAGWVRVPLEFKPDDPGKQGKPATAS